MHMRIELVVLMYSDIYWCLLFPILLTKHLLEKYFRSQLRRWSTANSFEIMIWLSPHFSNCRVKERFRLCNVKTQLIICSCQQHTHKFVCNDPLWFKVLLLRLFLLQTIDTFPYQTMHFWAISSLMKKIWWKKSTLCIWHDESTKLFTRGTCISVALS